MKKCLVTVIVPCRNEEKLIGKCIESIINQDYPNNKIEILIIDGMSDDYTEKIVKKYSKEYPFIKLLKNKKRIIPSALNIGIKNASGEIIVRMDSHNVYKNNYISKSVEYLLRYKVDNIGGICIILPKNNTKIAKAISLCLSCFFGIGNATYRIGCEKPKFVDTVPFGCYKKRIFNEIGMFDEKLLWSEDDEFNARIIKKGGRILLVPEIISYYYARDTLRGLAVQYFHYGYSKVKAIQKIRKIYTIRSIIPAIFVSFLIFFGVMSLFNVYFLWLFLIIFGLYFFINLWFSLKIAVHNDLILFPLIPIIFLTIHFSYALGFLKSIFYKYKK